MGHLAALGKMGRKRYSQRYIAFIDILGFRQLVQRSTSEKFLVKTIVNALSGLNNSTGIIRSISFSDSIIMSAPETQHGLRVLLMYAGNLQRDFLLEGILTRGSIVLGPVYHEDTIAFGPAVVEAYELEQHVAIYPRIVLHPTLGGLVVDMDDGSKMPLVIGDFDGFGFIDYLGPNFLEGVLPHKNQDAIYKKVGEVVNNLAFAHTYHPHNPDGSANPQLHGKYRWLVNYLSGDYYFSERERICNLVVAYKNNVQVGRIE
jgi:hypothetical protein